MRLHVARVICVPRASVSLASPRMPICLSGQVTLAAGSSPSLALTPFRGNARHANCAPSQRPQLVLASYVCLCLSSPSSQEAQLAVLYSELSLTPCMYISVVTLYSPITKRGNTSRRKLPFFTSKLGHASTIVTHYSLCTFTAVQLERSSSTVVSFQQRSSSSSQSSIQYKQQMIPVIFRDRWLSWYRLISRGAFTGCAALTLHENPLDRHTQKINYTQREEF